MKGECNKKRKEKKKMSDLMSMISKCSLRRRRFSLLNESTLLTKYDHNFKAKQSTHRKKKVKLECEIIKRNLKKRCAGTMKKSDEKMGGVGVCI